MCKFGITTTTLERQGDHLYIEIGMLFSCARLDKDDSRVFTPVLFDDDYSLELPALLVAGKRRYWSLRLSLFGLNGNVLKHYRIKKVLKALDYGSVDYMYRVKLGYQDWMDHAQISLSD